MKNCAPVDAQLYQAGERVITHLFSKRRNCELPFYFLLTRLLDLTCSWVSKDTTSVVLNGLFRTDMTYFCSPSSPD